MDALNKSLVALLDWFRSTTPAVRVTVVMLLAVAVGAGVYWFPNQTAGPNVYLLEGQPISSRDLRPMEAAFAKAGLNSHEIQGGRIRVPQAQWAAYMTALSDVLPPQPGGALARIEKEGSILDPKQLQEQRIKRAVQEELSLMIRSMKGIESAYVLYDSETRTFDRRKFITASVSVKPVGGGQLDESRVNSIRSLVAGAIAGLKPENVTVVDLNGYVYRSGQESGGSAESLALAVKQMHERDLRTKILEALDFIPNLSVELSVVLDGQHSNAAKPQPLKPVAAKSPEKTLPDGRTTPEGAQGNVPVSLAAEPPKEESDPPPAPVTAPRETVSEPAVADSRRLTPRLVKVSIGVPTSYFEAVWRKRHPSDVADEPRSPDAAALEQVRVEESAKIQRHVAPMLPPMAEVADPVQCITVTAFQDLKTPAAAAEIAPVKRACAWLSRHAGLAAMGLLGVAGLLVRRTMFRKAPAAAAPSQVELAPMLREEIALPEEPRPQIRPRPAERPALAAHGELSAMVRQNPAAAASVLRSWMHHAEGPGNPA